MKKEKGAEFLFSNKCILPVKCDNISELKQYL